MSRHGLSPSPRPCVLGSLRTPEAHGSETRLAKSRLPTETAFLKCRPSHKCLGKVKHVLCTSLEETTVPSHVLSPPILPGLLAAGVKREEHNTGTRLTKPGVPRESLSPRADMLPGACGKGKAMPYTDLVETTGPRHSLSPSLIPAVFLAGVPPQPTQPGDPWGRNGFRRRIGACYGKPIARGGSQVNKMPHTQV